MPLELRVACDLGHAQYMHGYLGFDVPMGITEALLQPVLAEHVWQFYVWCFGSANPLGPTANLAFAHWQEGVRIHGDPWVHSLVDFEYPIWANCTRKNPHNLRWYNLTGAVQTVDFQYHLAIFPNRGNYLRWYCDLILLGLRNGIGDFLLSVMDTSRGDFNKKLEERRKAVYKSSAEDLLTQLVGTRASIKGGP